MTAVYSGQADKAQILSHPDPMIRWYREMKEQPGVFEPSNPAWTGEKDGTKKWIYSGTIHDIAGVAANLCLKLHRTHPIAVNGNAKVGVLRHIWEEYGKQIVIGVMISIIGLVFGVAIGGV
jgi:hypothetical protein